jgi:hypothetical protein
MRGFARSLRRELLLPARWSMGSWMMLVAALTVGCGDTSGSYAVYEGVRATTDEASLSGQLLTEVDSLLSLLAFPRVLFFPIVLIAAWALSRVQQQLTRLALRMGLRRRRVVATSALVTIALWGWALALIAGRLLRAAPTLTLAVGALSSVLLLVGLSRQVENVAAGIGLAMRGRIEEGNQVTVGAHTGIVRHVGMMRVQLRTPDGDLVYVPNRQFVAEVVVIGRTRNSYPLVVELVRDHPWTSKELERAKLCATLSPYRDPHGRVSVTTARDGLHVLYVEMQVWMSRLLPAAEQHLRRQLGRHLALEYADGDASERLARPKSTRRPESHHRRN